MKGIYLLLGTNLGEREENISQARKMIEQEIGAITLKSGIYETAAWGVESEPDYLNQVIKINSDLDPFLLLKTILQIEKRLGRVRYKKWYSRIIDIDILFYDDQIIDTPTLKVPHPEIQNRLFTLIPLCEIAGEEIFPGKSIHIKELIPKCPDKLEVKSFSSSF